MRFAFGLGVNVTLLFFDSSSIPPQSSEDELTSTSWLQTRTPLLDLSLICPLTWCTQADSSVLVVYASVPLSVSSSVRGLSGAGRSVSLQRSTSSSMCPFSAATRAVRTHRSTFSESSTRYLLADARSVSRQRGQPDDRESLIHSVDATRRRFRLNLRRRRLGERLASCCGWQALATRRRFRLNLRLRVGERLACVRHFCIGDALRVEELDATLSALSAAATPSVESPATAASGPPRAGLGCGTGA